mmetsp:Transcript_5843/g.15559  ORF Transcript_5843/g.15559 Transcript_5843/m.15559 type:complete len:235 (-) Transcript_5843:673-1377(-)
MQGWVGCAIWCNHTVAAELAIMRCIVGWVRMWGDNITAVRPKRPQRLGLVRFRLRCLHLRRLLLLRLCRSCAPLAPATTLLGSWLCRGLALRRGSWLCRCLLCQLLFCGCHNHRGAPARLDGASLDLCLGNSAFAAPSLAFACTSTCLLCRFLLALQFLLPHSFQALVRPIPDEATRTARGRLKLLPVVTEVACGVPHAVCVFTEHDRAVVLAGGEQGSNLLCPGVHWAHHISC